MWYAFCRYIMFRFVSFGIPRKGCKTLNFHWCLWCTHAIHQLIFDSFPQIEYNQKKTCRVDYEHYNSCGTISSSNDGIPTHPPCGIWWLLSTLSPWNVCLRCYATRQWASVLGRTRLLGMAPNDGIHLSRPFATQQYPHQNQQPRAPKLCEYGVWHEVVRSNVGNSPTNSGGKKSCGQAATHWTALKDAWSSGSPCFWNALFKPWWTMPMSLSIIVERQWFARHHRRHHHA